ncbi:MAG: DNA polymerase III subunit delta' [Oscillospiraceae bacterium]|jgi:DNA polymerase III delta' subunit|nr:DNA polymerase III subunit delta' [Oscillospiraceae bacterium]
MLGNWRWPSAQSRLLLKSFQTGARPHAFLLTGPEGAGKRTLAKIYAAALMCEAAPQDRPCGKCSACGRAERGSHPDIAIIKPGDDPDSKARVITVKQAREARTALSSKAFEGRHKALIIQEADRMRPEAQNALLKTLEEPEAGCVFFLTADRRASLLPTVRSRCVWVPVPPLDISLATRVLIERGMDERGAAEAARFTRGAVGSALRYDGEVAPVAKRVRGALSGVRSFGDVPAAARLITAVYDEAKDPPERAIRANRVFESMEHVVRDALERLNAPYTAMDASLNLIERIERASARTLLSMLDSLAQARRRSGMFISFASVIDALIYSWLEDIDHAAGGRDQVP